VQDFCDGNHRTAYEVMKTFVEMNGGEMKVVDLREVITLLKTLGVIVLMRLRRG